MHTVDVGILFPVQKVNDEEFRKQLDTYLIDKDISEVDVNSLRLR